MRKSKNSKKLIVKTTIGELVVALSDASKKNASSANESIHLTSIALNHLLGRKGNAAGK